MRCIVVDGNRMIDWEDLTQRQINKIPRALPEPIRARATEVLVFFGPARDEKSFACLGVFEGIIQRSDPLSPALLNSAFGNC